jgi:hypothetical protein
MELVGLTTIKDGRLYLMNRLDRSYVERYRYWKNAVTGFDPYTYVISANIHRRHLTVEQRRELIAKLLKADPSKSDRQVAGIVKASPTFIGKVRAEKEATGDVSTVDTRTDTKGRQQPARKVMNKPEQKVLNAPSKVSHAAGENRDDVGPASNGETERLRARNEELERENRRLEIENIGLRSEIGELRARLGSPQPADDGLDIPDYLDRTRRAAS